LGKTGQRIVERVMRQSRFVVLAPGDIGLATRDALGPTVFVDDGQAATEHPHVMTIIVTQPILALEVRGFAAEMSVETGPQTIEIVGMNAAQPHLRIVDTLRRGVADHFPPARREIDVTAF
jgi:hypothetical protein